MMNENNILEKMIYFNDKAVNIQAQFTLMQLLKQQSIDPLSVALVVNQGVVPRSLWQTQVCQNEDRIDVFTVVAGG
ncbi:sulfur carrier protein ThiS [uncultured Shewanella sp.]|uniref:sulfur carrier protein ThiS n=1 Tax=uncultured Shewanella sp. TaxID=173975 RepID=UPI00261A45CE|nr:sulfur carrier protein ThiS [uncultured Shewanella sp.]